MHQLSMGLALLAALAILVVGALYLARPSLMTSNFGLPPPEEGRNIVWWLRLKGVRDIVSGLVVLAVMVWGGSWTLGLVLLVEALIPVGDMGVVLAGRGSVRTALGVHGLTAAVMVFAAVPLLTGGR